MTMGSGDQARLAIFYSDFASRETTRVHRLARSLSRSDRGLALSPDRRTLLFTQLDSTGSDLMLLENFR